MGPVFSVIALGRGRLASASADNTVRVWDASSGVCLCVLEGHMDWVNSVTALGDGRLESATADDTVRLWVAPSGFCLETVPSCWLSCVTALRLASASNDKTVRVWDASSGVCLRVLEGHTDTVYSVTALDDGRLASASDDNTVRVWDASSGVCLETVRPPPGSRDFPRAAELYASALPGTDVPASFHCGRTAAHFSPWGASPVYLCANVTAAHIFSLPDGRRVVAAAALRNGQVHFFELVQAPVPDGGGH